MVYIKVSKQLACLDSDKKVSYVNLHQMNVDKQLQAAFEGSLTCIAYNDTTHEIAVGDSVGEIKIFSNLDGSLNHLDQYSHSAPITSLVYSPCGQKLISGDSNGKILVWKVNNF